MRGGVYSGAKEIRPFRHFLGNRSKLHLPWRGDSFANTRPKRTASPLVERCQHLDIAPKPRLRDVSFQDPEAG